MKNSILKWLGFKPSAFDYEVVGEIVRISVKEELAKQIDPIQDGLMRSINNSYDLDGMVSKLDDMEDLTQDLESRGNRWDDMADKMDDMDIDDLVSDIESRLDLDKVQELDDRLTELLAGYKLEVKLTQENF